MYSKILFTFSVLAACNGNNNEKATSFISYHRDDVPLSYNFNQIHILDYETPKKNNQRRSPSIYEVFKRIQYAPVDIIPKEQTTETTTTKREITSESNVRKKPAEPNLDNSPSSPYNTQDIRGHNIVIPRDQVLYSDNKHETDYNKETKNIQRGRKIAGIQKNLVTDVYNSNKESKKTPIAEIKMGYAANMRSPTNNMLLNQEMLQAALQRINLQYSRQAVYKLPRLSLNERRSYNIANLPNKERIHYRTYTMGRTKTERLF